MHRFICIYIYIYQVDPPSSLDGAPASPAASSDTKTESAEPNRSFSEPLNLGSRLLPAVLTHPATRPRSPPAI